MEAISVLFSSLNCGAACVSEFLFRSLIQSIQSELKGSRFIQKVMWYVCAIILLTSKNNALDNFFCVSFHCDIEKPRLEFLSQ